jgi:hypothetical protein
MVTFASIAVLALEIVIQMSRNVPAREAETLRPA